MQFCFPGRNVQLLMLHALGKGIGVFGIKLLNEMIAFPPTL